MRKLFEPPVLAHNLLLDHVALIRLYRVLDDNDKLGLE